MKRGALIDRLLAHEDPSVRWKVRVALGESARRAPLKRLQEVIRHSPTVAALLRTRDAKGRMHHRGNIYGKWQGAHWVLAALADIGYPSGDATLKPMIDEVVAFWLRPEFYQEFEPRSKSDVYKKAGGPVMQGRHRRHASQQGRALLVLCTLTRPDQRARQLVERLLYWQWPDGGWNCDRNPSADTSSFMESILPMRGLWAYAQASGDAKARQAALRAADVFLSRRLFKRRRDGRVIASSFVKLHYPLYWHYDFLGGLKAMAELGLIRDKRCADALDLLETKELAAGGWAAEERYFRFGARLAQGFDYVDWGGTSRTKMNPWITADAVSVLAAAGRL